MQLIAQSPLPPVSSQTASKFLSALQLLCQSVLPAASESVPAPEFDPSTVVRGCG
ncbi:hypothetical protein TIFTF001_011228 [Ficus carica]|uniref:Uncharacterized protein n=1 Tax=Ficus carica TaxID=3494 RepID=A0AA87ZWT3_FICCA|nr:hypothetical protein TIFTF001_011228 [Ficus carica]